MGIGYGDPATPDQIEQAIEQLSDGEWMKIRKLSSRHLWGTRMSDPDELVNETLDRLIRGKRHWPTGLPFIPWLGGAMKSIADGLRNLDCVKLEALAGDLAGGEGFVGDPMDTFTSNRESPLDAMLTEEAKKDGEARRAKLDDYFRGDEDVGWILMGIEDGLRGEDIQKIGGMGKTQYETARRRLRRGIEHLFPARIKS